MSYGNDDSYRREEQQRRDDERRRDEQRRFQQQQDDERRRQDERRRMDETAHYRKREEAQRLDAHLREKKADEQRYDEDKSTKERAEDDRADAQRNEYFDQLDQQRRKAEQQGYEEARSRHTSTSVPIPLGRKATSEPLLNADEPLTSLIVLVLLLLLFCLPPLLMYEGLEKFIKLFPRWSQYKGVEGQIAGFYSHLLLDSFTKVYQYIQVSVMAKNYWMLSLYFVGAWLSIIFYFVLLVVVPNILKVLMLLTPVAVGGTIAFAVFRLG